MYLHIIVMHRAIRIVSKMSACADSYFRKSPVVTIFLAVLRALTMSVEFIPIKRLVRAKLLFFLNFLLICHMYNSMQDSEGQFSTVTKRVVRLGPAEVRIMQEGNVRIQIIQNEQYVLNASLGYFLPPSWPEIYTVYSKSLTFVWNEDVRLEISQDRIQDVQRLNISWTVTGSHIMMLKDVVSLEGYHWFGGTHISKLLWPVEKWDMKLRPFVTGVTDSKEDYGNVQERYWFSSAGVALVISKNDPLSVAFKSKTKEMTLASCWKSPYNNQEALPLTLSYSFYVASDILKVHKFTSKLILRKPTKVPDILNFRHPIWTTWIAHKWYTSQEKVVKYADDIFRYGFNASLIEIDDDWTPAYGDLDFDPVKFPNPVEMIKSIHKYNFRVSLWVPPFCSLKSDSSSNKNLWVKGWPTGIVYWWDGFGRILDVTNPVAQRWFKSRLYRLRLDYNITTFKFDAGESRYLPYGFKTQHNLASPNDYTNVYGRLAAEIDGNYMAAEIRSAYQTQHLPIFLRFMDKDSNWSYDNGLKTLIPHALQFGLLGYFFFIPDIIGGNQYVFEQTSKELFIRWVQASVFMPVMVFSKPPWDYDEETVRITKEMTQLHFQYSDYILRIANQALVTREPIVRPIWWYSPQDETALTIDSEFLVGDQILVAPVLEPNARSRDIYLPEGRWKRNGEEFQGPKSLKDYPVKLEELAFFHRVDSTDPFLRI